jgi:hypothetical protein
MNMRTSTKPIYLQTCQFRTDTSAVHHDDGDGSIAPSDADTPRRSSRRTRHRSFTIHSAGFPSD